MESIECVCVFYNGLRIGLSGWFGEVLVGLGGERESGL
jgi:hypothetical protein